MKRFFGMMPSNEIEIEKYYKDNQENTITIQAGPHGWTIIYTDGSSTFKDVDAEACENFNDAYALAINQLGELTLNENVKCGEI